MPIDDQIRQRTLQIVGPMRVGLLMTTDPDGYPHGRWMHALPVNGLKRVFSLTADGTRKIEHIEREPRVAWMFASDDHRDVLLLKGRAEVHHDFSETLEAWDRLSAAIQEYAIGPLSDGAHVDLVTIETTVEQMELISPDLGLESPRELGAP